MRESSQPQITLYRCKFVLEKTGLKRSSLYKLIHLGTFPRPIKITAKAVAWPSNEVEDWIKNRILFGQQNVPKQNFAVSLKGAK
jgi:prophage regulatory protein